MPPSMCRKEPCGHYTQVRRAKSTLTNLLNFVIIFREQCADRDKSPAYRQYRMIIVKSPERVLIFGLGEKTRKKKDQLLLNVDRNLIS